MDSRVGADWRHGDQPSLSPALITRGAWRHQHEQLLSGPAELKRTTSSDHTPPRQRRRGHWPAASSRGPWMAGGSNRCSRGISYSPVALRTSYYVFHPSGTKIVTSSGSGGQAQRETLTTLPSRAVGTGQCTRLNARHGIQDKCLESQPLPLPNPARMRTLESCPRPVLPHTNMLGTQTRPMSWPREARSWKLPRRQQRLGFPRRSHCYIYRPASVCPSSTHVSRDMDFHAAPSPAMSPRFFRCQ